MADLFLGETMTRKYRFIASNTAETISDIGFRPDYIMVKRIDSAYAADGTITMSEWDREMTNADALQFRSILDDGNSTGTTQFFETTNGITLTTNASGVDSFTGVITGATAADPVVITDAAHGLSNGDTVRITDVVGMIELNNRRFRVSNAATNTFELQDPETRTDIDGSNFTAYVSGGRWNRLNRVDANRDVFDAETFDITLGTATLTNDI